MRQSFTAILVVAVLLPAGVHAQGRAYQRSSYPSLPPFSAGARLGGAFFTDSGARDLYDGLLHSGADFKLHFFNLPLAAQTSFDFSGGDGDDPAGLGFTAEDIDIFLFNWRVSLLLEPPPAYLGDRNFYVQPYVGGGIGVHFVEEEISSRGPFFIASESESRSAFGYHAVAGIDFVFASHASFGVEALYTDAAMDTPLTDHEVGGFAISASFKWHF
jgi:opacity protein-like surface antigen